MDAYGLVSIAGLAAVSLIVAKGLSDAFQRVHAQAVKAGPAAAPRRRRRRRRRS